MYSLKPFLPLLLATLIAPLYSQSHNPLPVADPILAGRFLVAYNNGTIPADAETNLEYAGFRLLGRTERFGIAVVAASNAAALRNQPNVQYVIQDRMLTSSALPTAIAAPVSSTLANADAFYTSPRGWAVRQIGGGTTGRGAWNTTKGSGVRIAILDSGVDANHPDIAPNLGLNLTEIDQTPVTGLPSACDDGSAQDQQGHGTWTASLAAGALGAQTGLVAGVAPEATILNIKVLERMPAVANDPTTCATGQGSGLLSWIIKGIDDAVTNHADIISMSLGTLVDLSTTDGAGLKTTFDNITHAAAQAGTILIAAAGNDGVDLSNTRYMELPAQSRDVLAIVASTNPACAENLTAGSTCAAGSISLPYYSNHGAPLHALAAPGGSYPSAPGTANSLTTGWVQGACSAGKTNTLDGAPTDANHSFGCFGLGHIPYVLAMGTSAAAPLTAGAAALVRAAHPEWSADAVVAALRSSATVVHGLPVAQVNAAAAIAFP